MNPLTIEIIEAPITSNTIKGKNGDFQIYSQTGYAYTGDKFPVKCSVQIESKMEPHSVGMHNVDFQRSVVVDNYGSLSLARRLVLIPVKK